MKTEFDAPKALYAAWLNTLGGKPGNDIERELRQISGALDAAMENAGVDFNGIVAEYERAARQAGFMAGLTAGIQLAG